MGIEDSGPGRTQDYPGSLLSHLSHSASFPAPVPQVGPPSHCPEMPTGSFHQEAIS